jgi:hypothetical protein
MMKKHKRWSSLLDSFIVFAVAFVWEIGTTGLVSANTIAQRRFALLLSWSAYQEMNVPSAFLD